MKRLFTGALLGLIVLGGYTIWSVFVSNNVLPTENKISNPAPNDTLIPAVSLITIDGQSINLRDDRGQVTIFFVMSYWCTTCVPEAQALARLHDQYESQGLKVVVIDLDPCGEPDLLRLFIDEVGANRLIWAMDPESVFMQHYNVQALDTTIIVNQDGYEVYCDFTSTSYADLESLILPLLRS